MVRCRARTRRGGLCRNPVRRAGLRCWRHQGMPEAGPVQRRPARSGIRSVPARRSRESSTAARRKAAQTREQRELKLVKAAADYCSETLSDGWAETVAGHITDYVSDETWRRLVRGRRRQCRALARLAQEILALKQQVHDLLGTLVRWILELTGVGETARDFAGELAANIPITPLDAKLVAVARGVQVAGIVVCVLNGQELTHCQCFIDLALTETKTQVKKILLVAMGDWRNLADLRRPGGPRRAAQLR